MQSIRLTAIVLALALAGAAQAQETLLPIAPEVRLAPGEGNTFDFAVRPGLLAQRPALRLLARLDRETLGGSTYALRLRVNDQPIAADRLLNKPLEGRVYAGMILPWFGRGSLRVVYSPDYEAANQPDERMAFVGGKAYEFVIAVADLLGEGANTLRLQHTVPNIPQGLVISEIALVPTPEPLPPAEDEVGAPPPTGELPVIAPKPVEPVAYRVEPLARGGFAIVAGEQRALVRSAFSWPNVGWNALDEIAGEGEEPGWRPEIAARPDGAQEVRAAGASYELERTVISRADHVEVADRIVNTSGADLHVSLRHGIALAGLPEARIHLHGTELLLPSGSFRGGDNPSALVSAGGWGFGMLAEDDVLRVQSTQLADPELGEVGLLDHLFLPAMSLTVGSIAAFSVIMRSSLVDVMTEDYITTARAKGLSEFGMLKSHAVPNAMAPMVTLIAMDIAFVVGGAFQTEYVFNYKGIGYATVKATMGSDYPYLQAAFLIIAVAVIFANLLADIALLYIDPRVKTK